METDNRDYGLSPQAIKAAAEGYDLGTSLNLEQHLEAARPINRYAALERIAEAIAEDAAFAEQVVDRLGWENLNAARPQTTPKPMPFRGIRAIECSISYSPPRPRKASGGNAQCRSRPEREALPYWVTIQMFDAKSKGLADPAWKGSAQLRTPARAAKDARKTDKLTSLSSEYAQWIEDAIVPCAETNGMYVGFVMDKRKGHGTYYHEFQVMLIDQASVENRTATEAFIVGLKKDRQVAIVLPAFDTKTSRGALRGNFVMQSRGSISAEVYTDWQTGVLEIR